MKHQISEEKSMVVELRLELAKTKVAVKFTEDKIHRMEARFATNQVKVIYGVLKSSLIAYEIGFTKCKYLTKQRLPETDADSLG